MGPFCVRPAAVAGLLCAALLNLEGCGARSTLDAGSLPEREREPEREPEPPAETPPLTPSAGAPSVGPTRPPEPPLERCESVSLTIDELRPSVTLLVDQSYSMVVGYPTRGSGQSRWDIVRDALMDPKAGVVARLQSSIQFGLSFYTSYNGSSGGACPVLSEVTTATDNYDSIRDLYDRTSPGDDTPTGAAIQQVVSRLESTRHLGPQVLLLVTDGDPDTCAQPDPQNGQQEALDAATRAHEAGIDFYVLGVSQDISGDKLQQLANAGHGKRLGAQWGVDADAARPYQASSSVAELTEQLQQILERVPLCEVQLERDVTVEELRAASVTLDGKRLQLDAPDGYRRKAARRLEIVGAACEGLKNAGRRLSVRISCD
ncbi:MAG: VWA domain-containing protein [Myxococcales bacterium]|nr:MAG: VWA domain-containing protein [Myxococcales bacterium]